MSSFHVFVYAVCLCFSHINVGPEYQVDIPEFCGECYFSLLACLVSRYRFLVTKWYELEYEYLYPK